ncbi:MAG: 23S ribosomal RNA methyltransferase Erm [Candidatus Dojkabacteria bacterium]
MVDIKYTQNIYRNRDKIVEILDKIDISKQDTVLDIGAGKGILTEELVKRCKDVIAYEIDNHYYEILKEKFSTDKNITIYNKDFLNSNLPNTKYKVFANIPFSQTSDIIKKLTDTPSNMSEGWLFVQKESAQRYVGKPNNTQISSILSFMYDIDIVEIFRREDFQPIPNVDIVLLHLKSKEYERKDYNLYKDFITYIFNQRNKNIIDTFKKLFTYKQLKHIKEYLKSNNCTKPTQIPTNYYLELFNQFKLNGDRYLYLVKGYSSKHISQHSKREKVYRRR